VTEQRPPIITTATHLRYENDYVRVYDNEVTFSNGQPGTYVRIDPVHRGRGAVALVAAENHIALVRTYRYPLGRWEWALPRGFSDGDDSATTVRREVLEELGIDIDTFVRIGTITPDSGLLSTHVDVYRATLPTRPTSHPIDSNEVAELAWVERTELGRRIASGAIADAFTLAALTLDRYSTD
jgi:8-oxo-dGTP pyrophosphatase MutT (NUDIX family)